MKKRYWIALAAGLALAMLSAVVVFALVDVTVDWWVFASGGAPSSGGSISMNGTLGQPVVGQSSGGSVLLGAGYWVASAENAVYLPLVLRNHSP